MRRSPKEAQPRLVRAAARAALHRFAEAEADLAAARELGPAEARHQADGILVGVLAARGQAPAALALSQRLAASEREQSLVTLAQRAGLLGALGQIDAPVTGTRPPDHHAAEAEGPANPAEEVE